MSQRENTHNWLPDTTLFAPSTYRLSGPSKHPDVAKSNNVHISTRLFCIGVPVCTIEILCLESIFLLMLTFIFRRTYLSKAVVLCLYSYKRTYKIETIELICSLFGELHQVPHSQRRDYQPESLQGDWKPIHKSL